MCYYLAEDTNVPVSAGGWLGLLGFRGLGRVHQEVTLRHGCDEITTAGEKILKDKNTMKAPTTIPHFTSRLSS